MGSIAAGGRYDNLVGMFSSSGQQTPCVGVSIGVERVFTIMERKAASTGAADQHSDVQVYIASVGAGYLVERMKVARLLWQNNIPAEYSHLQNPKMVKQLDEALARYIPVMVVFGEDELQRKVIRVKNMKDHEEVEVSCDEASLVEAVLKAGGKQVLSGSDFSLIEAMRS
jgi:histidyl-tRNA synthetase